MSSDHDVIEDNVKNCLLRAALLAGALAGAGPSSAQFLEAVLPCGDSPIDIVWSPGVNKIFCANSQDASITVIDGDSNFVRSTIFVGDYPSFLCLNGDGTKLYCARGEENTLTVIDAVAETVLKQVSIPNYPGPMCFNTTMNKLYVACNDDPVYRIAVLDASADTVLRYIPVRGVGRLLWHPATNRVFTCGADTIRVIDCVTDQIIVRMRGGDDLVLQSGERTGLPGCEI